jgi:type I restriction enzyme M protein
MLEPYEGRVYEPAFGSGGLLVQSASFVEAHGGRPEALSIYGQENNQATWRIGRMNLAIHGLSGNLQLGNTLLDDKFKDLRADFLMANPPFNMKAWGANRVAGDVRWNYGEPPENNANYAWIQHFIHHLAPDGRAGFVMANGSLTAGGQEGRIREKVVRDDLVDCIVALPPQLFFTTGIPVCLWYLDRNKARAGDRDRRGETLFIDARSLGEKISRTQIELTGAEIARTAETYRAWRGTATMEYGDEPGFAKSATVSDIEAAGFMLSPGRFVEGSRHASDPQAFRERLEAMSGDLSEALRASAEAEARLRIALKALGIRVDSR